MKTKRIICLFLLLSLLTGLIGCANTVNQESTPPGNTATAEEEKPTEEIPSEPEPEPVYTNPLTGETTDSATANRRPYAIMLNNIKVALPQYGVSQADMIFEIPVEGGITRMLGVFQDVSTLHSIGSIRSARPYYIELAQGLDAVYIHAGGSPQAYTDMANKHIDHIDGVNGNTSNVFFRDKDRIYRAGYEHSMFTTGDRLSGIVGTMQSLRHDHAEDYVFPRKYVINGTPDGEEARSLTAYFNSYKSTSFTYDADRGLYLVSEYGAPYTDGDNNADVAVTNVLCLHTDIHQIAGDNKGRMSVRTTGSGTGTFACGGKAVPILWNRDTVEEPFRYTLEDGTELSLGIGHSYICIIPANGTVTLN